MPWKKCYYCGGYSYSAATVYDHWTCPYCRKDLTGSPECDRPLRVIEGPAGEAGAGAGRTAKPRPHPPARRRRLRLV
ncbi:MAG: hypothetical protein ACYC9Q_13220 [Bacillota bacterium]